MNIEVTKEELDSIICLIIECRDSKKLQDSCNLGYLESIKLYTRLRGDE